MQKRAKMMQRWSQNVSQNRLKSGKIRKKGMRKTKRKFDAKKSGNRTAIKKKVRKFFKKSELYFSTNK